ncbi:two-component system LytT family sensor kinase [Prauserella isguenensis]|uniref:Two-component system LytT family sensor kinase n=1 Tax=Prauserella isguenensis TaxID=1470180 RepID=A0A839RWT9_9PSEU|nr:two-component system LytT family sensor kinase [Prauserella isguenensis]
MSEQLTVPIALGAIIALLVITLAIVLLKRRKPTSAIDDAVLEAVYVMAKAPLELREGLDQAAAEKMTSRLLKLLKGVAVGITDGEGTLLAWDGEANDHYVDLVDTIGTCIRKHRREVVSHDKMPCNHRGTCRMRTAVLVPLIVEGETDAVLIVVGKTKGKRIVQMADAVARFVGTQLEAARLEDTKHQLHQAEIKALRAQISPHFVYNALNTISSLIRTDPEEARELLQDFADFTRYCFRTEGTFTTLSDELRNIDRYLTIESARYGGRLGVRLKIAPEVQSVVVPFLLIQPLVENAVKHGIANKPGGGTVTVTAQDYGTEAEISVEDDGVGMDPKQLDGMRDSRSSAHIGLTGINRRMSQVFGNRYSLVVETAPGAGMKVTMRVPKFVRGVRPDMLKFAAEGTSDDDPSALPGGVAADGSLAATSSGSVPDGSGAPTAPPAPAQPPSTPPTQPAAAQSVPGQPGPGQPGSGQPGSGRGGPAPGPAGPAGPAPAQPSSPAGRRGSTHPGMTPAHGASSPGQQRPSTQQPPAAPPQENPAPGQGTRQTSSQPSRRPVARQASEAKQAARAAQAAARGGKPAERKRRADEEPDPTSTPRST